MRKRDLAILLFAAIAVFLTLQREGDFSFKEAWSHLADEQPVRHEAERLPPPLVADLNGDGRKEILVATHDAKILLLEPHSRRIDEGFTDARVMAEVSLLPDKVRIASGRRPVSMAVGVVDRSYHKGDIIKQVLVVVTSGWSVMCFDHNLKKLWENNLQEDFPHGAHHREIAISISNYTLKHVDAGLIIIGGRMDHQHHMSMDVIEEIMTEEDVAQAHRRSVNEKEATDNGTMDLRHFVFYAFAGRSGTLRWSRKNENIQAQPSDAAVLIPQHNYKLDTHALNSKQPGEFECREFRESILGVMPHHWDRREDTYLELTHFRKHKRKSLKKLPGKSSFGNIHKPVEHNQPGKDTSNMIAQAVGKAAEYASSTKSRKMQKSHYIPTITNYTQVWWVPNVVVAHEKEGIEAVHLASGRTVCKLRLTEGGLHADVNGDGVLDHIQVVGGKEHIVVSGSTDILKPCWAVATSGVPVREQLFNVSICRPHHFNLFHHGEFVRSFEKTHDANSLEVATPILIRRDDGHKHRKGSHGDVIFLTSRGEMTSYTPGLVGHEAVWRWQILTDATWSNTLSPTGLSENAVVPTLKALALQVHRQEEVIIAAGDMDAVVVSPAGSILTSFELPAPPTHALVLEDFSGDGLTDVILVTSGGIYGFVQTRQPGAVFFATLVGCLIAVMFVLFISQQLKSGSNGKPRVSTDYR